MPATCPSTRRAAAPRINAVGGIGGEALDAGMVGSGAGIKNKALHRGAPAAAQNHPRHLNQATGISELNKIMASPNG
jgi:hypothetical protein